VPPAVGTSGETVAPRKEGALRVLNLGGGDVDTGTPMGSMVFTVMAALAQMSSISKGAGGDSVSKRRAAGLDVGGRRQVFTDRQVESAAHLIEEGQPAVQVAARDLGMSRATLYRRIRELPSGAV
jgi:DNA invertase Pin-like site-specific DNA recombinase